MDQIRKYIHCILRFNNPRLQDVTPLFNDSVPFLVSGEMLMMTALMDDNYNLTLGGQSLHFIYICERLLNVFKKNNGAFQIVFFDVWEKILRPWNLRLYREILLKHFEKNTDVPVHCFGSVYDPAFLALIESLRPGFFLYNLDATSQLSFFRNNRRAFLALFCAEFVFCLKWDLPVVDLATINVEVSLVRSYLLENDVDYKVLPDFRMDVEKITATKDEENTNISFVYQCAEIREFITCNAVCDFLKKYPEQTNDARLFVLYVVAMENLKLENRGCPLVKITDDSKIKNNIFVWKEIIFWLLKNVGNRSMQWKNVCDLWQGTLLAVVYTSIDKNVDKESLGEFAVFYEKYIEKINSVLSEQQEITPYPIEPYTNKPFCEFKMPYCRENKDQVPLEVVNNSIVKRFCDNLIGHITWANPSSVLEKNNIYDEVRHWHSRRPITDDCDHVKHDEFDRRNATTWEITRYDKQKMFQARWLNVYGTNLIGNSQVYETIICEEDSKPVKKTKESNKAKLLKAQNMKEKEEKIKKNEQVKYLELKKAYKSAPSDLASLTKIMTGIELFVEKSESAEVTLECLVLKAIVHNKICEKLKKNNGVGDSDVTKLFLTIREILKLHNTTCTLTEKQQKQVSKILHKLGFADIALHNNLESVEVDKGDIYYNKEDSINFQLRCLGPKMEREVVGKYDPDIGFTPDPWQCKFIHAIRNNQSALVVAPTSSGKTFASYYCMKRVLQKSKDGVVVYVSPTKALVNQVSATIFVKFRNAPSQPGVSTVGVFTRDYRINAMNSRILVTVPQCLEILLMSPRRYTWVKKIKYVIFDEIHCLKGSYSDTAGITWERCVLLIRCPFLALSATVRNPEDFHQWLSNNEKFKELEDKRNGFERWYSSTVNLVIYSERHSDLVKYTYLQGKGLQHCHPYSFLGHDILNLCRSIPDGTSMSALEVLQLYNVLKANAPEYFTGEKEITTFFASHSKKGFITHRNVKDFEMVLREIFFKIYENNFECYEQILKDLQPQHSVTRDDVGYDYSRKNMIDLLKILHQRNMLPALVFCYHRGYIEVFNSETAEYFDSLIDVPDRREAKKLEKLQKKEKKELHKLEAKAGESSNSFKEAHTSSAFNLLENKASSFLKGVGVADHDDISYIEQRLARKSGQHSRELIKSMRHGFAFHHAALNNTYRSTIEMLFRIGMLKVVFATGTLAMGIHMPCKTVVICCDSPFLSSLEYHQMAGRAGRRGFDNEGNVVFMGLNKRRQKTLLTSRLPVIDGNFPLTITFIMRLLLLVTRVSDSEKQTEQCVTRTLSSVTTLLENSLAFRKFPMLRDQMKHFFCFGTQLLYLQKMISRDGNPLKLCSIITHLHYHEPANFAFVYILRTGAIRKMINKYRGDNTMIQWNLIVMMNFLFARLPLHKTQLDKEYNNSCVILEPLSPIIAEALKRYNRQVKFVFDEYFANMYKYCTEKYGPDNKLPLSGIRFENGVSAVYESADCVSDKIRGYCRTRSICSTFCSLSSNGDGNLYSERNLINNIRDEVCSEVKVVPIINVDLQINSYAADFYRHGIVNAIVSDNGLKHGEEYQRLNDFRLVLKTVVLALEELEPIDKDDVILYHFKAILEKYQHNFFNAFQ